MQARGRAARRSRASSARRAGRGSSGAWRRRRSRARTARGSSCMEATDGRRDHAEALLALDPELGREGLDAALVLGEAERVRAALARDPGLATRAGGARDWLPLLYPCHSAFLGGERTDGLVECARVLLEAGADPDSSWQHPEFGSLGALYGAAGVAHEPRMTALLLEAGAEPNDDESVYHATETGDDTCLRLLLAAGARVEGTNALAHCLDAEKPAMLRLLLDHDPGREVERLAAVGDLPRALAGGAADAGRRRRRRERVGRAERAHAVRARVADGPTRPVRAAGRARRAARGRAGRRADRARLRRRPRRGAAARGGRPGARRARADRVRRGAAPGGGRGAARGGRDPARARRPDRPPGRARRHAAAPRGVVGPRRRRRGAAGARRGPGARGRRRRHAADVDRPRLVPLPRPGGGRRHRPPADRRSGWCRRAPRSSRT